MASDKLKYKIHMCVCIYMEDEARWLGVEIAKED